MISCGIIGDMQRALLSLTVFFIFGCVYTLPSIPSQYPKGYDELTSIIPECKNISLDNYAACLVSSQILESQTPQQATIIFIKHWEQTAFGEMESMRNSMMINRDLTGSLVLAKVKYDEAQRIKTVVMPILKNKYFQNKDNEYAKKMLPHLDLIEVLSKASFDSFREIHVKAVTQ